jgi:hypothetical protein
MPPNILPTLWTVIKMLNYVIVPNAVKDRMCDKMRSYFVDTGTSSMRQHTDKDIDKKEGKGQRTQKNFLFGGEKGEKRADKKAFLDSVRQLAWHP